MGFSRQEYWSGLSFPSLGELPNPAIKSASPALAGGFFIPEPETLTQSFPPMTTATWRLLIWSLITGSKPSPFLRSLVPLRSKSNYTSVVFLKGSIHLVTHFWLKILHSVFNKTKFYLTLWSFLFLHHSCILFNCYQFSECHIVSSHKFLRSMTSFFHLSIHIQNFPYLVMA